MLELRKLTKQYKAGGITVEALRGVDMALRKNEFVAILGPSGCGKTTLLNIIGGLDHADGGDLLINGRSTKEYKDRDWDNYRNHRIGFVFQSYNLIPHQTVLANVELALTLSGVNRQERKKRALEALEKVGLRDQARKKPNQVSGGQMQRVAIARALVNNPEILLADEPTGALDTETGLQVMELLKQIAQDRLVIMVTHNPELANEYATRIIQLKDGQVMDDTMPCSPEELAQEDRQTKPAEKKPSMSFGTALSLSFQNLLTKKGRTVLTSFAGSIGIIGIALILSISTGVKMYIDRVQRDTLSSYPLQIQKSSIDMSSMMLAMMDSDTSSQVAEEGYVISGDVMSRMLNSMNMTMTHNNLKSFKAWLDSEESGVQGLVSDIRYGYGNTLNIYRKADGKVIQVNPSQVLQQSGLLGSDNSMMGLLSASEVTSTSFSQMDVFSQLLDNQEMIQEQYDVLAGRLPQAYNELVVIVTRRGAISDYTLYALGLRDQSEIADLTTRTMSGEQISVPVTKYSYEELMNLSFRLMMPCDLFELQADGTYLDRSGDQTYLEKALDKAPELHIVGILRPKEDAVSTQAGASGAIGYLSALIDFASQYTENSSIVSSQRQNPEIDVLTGFPFAGTKAAEDFTVSRDQIPELYKRFTGKEMPALYQAALSTMSDEQFKQMIETSMAGGGEFSSSSTYESNLTKLGVTDLSDPSNIYIYAKDFESKEKTTDLINKYNQNAGEGNEITYTDIVGAIMSSVTNIVNAVTYVLIAFVAISLVVSSLMIGIITYISVLERTKEIGILRAIGASKRDISRVFNAETLIIGFISGVLGILCTLMLNIFVNIIIHDLTGISATAVLPAGSAGILILISMLLTLVAGLIPSGAARRKDPVAALRTE